MTRLRTVHLAVISMLLLAGCDLGVIGFPGIGLEQPAPAEPTPRDDAREPEQEQEPAGTQVACPIGMPRTYTDSWMAPRSGGRGHLGVDMLAPSGTPIYAYEAGVVSRMSQNTLGGITLSLEGDSGDHFYYAHLSGYVDGLETGQRVNAGDHIAHTGDTGNAAGTPHLHFEVRPDGGDNVNPFPLVERVCV
jgi:murein DD-endopeptidase MepM/ murein hydrolase activator NlpD